MAAYSSVLFFSTLIFLLLALTLRSRRRRSSLKLPPGPMHIPILGDLHLIDRVSLHRSFWFLSQKHGPLMQLQLGQKPTVVVSSATMAAEVFKNNDQATSGRAAFVPNRMLSYNFSDVALSLDSGSYWKEMRRQLIRDLLHVKKVQSFRSIREAEIKRMISAISASTTPQPVDLKKISINLTNNIACTAAFGKSYMEGSERERVYEMVVQGAYVLGEFFVEDFLPWLRWIDVVNGLHAKLDKSFRELDEFYEKVIEDHVVPKRRNEENEDYVDVLLRAQKQYSHLTREGIKGIMMDILFGATDTGAAVVTWGMAELMRSPQEMKKCQEEVRRIVGKKGKVDEDDLAQLHYLKSVVKESMRLHPPLPMLVPRDCTQHCNIDGYDVLPGTTLIINAWAIGRDPSAWDCPDEFLPERFMNSSIDYKGNDFEFLPFGSGRRGCPGYHFAAPTVELSMANLLYSFDWELPPGVNKETLDMTEASGFIKFPKSSLLVPKKYGYAYMS